MMSVDAGAGRTFAKRLGGGLALIASLGALVASPAGAVTEEELLNHFGTSGEGAGQLSLVRGIASDPVTGHVFLAEHGNKRISEFTPWGEFVKAFGWDVAPGPVDEEQELRIRAASGQFRLGFGASTTGDLDYGATAEDVETALNALPSIASGAGSVAVEAVLGNTLGTPYIYVVRFGASLAHTDVPAITASNGSTPLSGGGTTSLEVRIRADGTPGGTGLESCTVASGCKKGSEGVGSGQISQPFGLAVDAAGDIYLRESNNEVNNQRIQKFDSAGRFLLMFGGEVNKTTGEDICTAGSGDVCGAGIPGSSAGSFSGGIGVSIDTNGTVFVAAKERIVEFDSNGSFKSEVPLTGIKNPRFGLNAQNGDLYVFDFNKPDVSKFSPSGSLLDTLPVPHPVAIATDSGGNVYVADAVNHETEEPERVLEFDPSGTQMSRIVQQHLSGPSEITALGTNLVGDVFVSMSNGSTINEVISYGDGPTDFESPPKVPPSIVAQYATSIGTTGATLRAQINPHFWQDARYYVEYGKGRCSEGGCDQTRPVPPGILLTSQATSTPVTSSGILLESLEPASIYHYRFIAKSSGGGPVVGIDPDGEGPGEATPNEGLEASFRTFAVPGASNLNCTNRTFRTGPSAALPDCRAYEMVSPIDKENGDIEATLDDFGYPTSLYQASRGDTAFTYSSPRAFGGSSGAPIPSQYLAARGVDGWSSRALSPPREIVGGGNTSLENEYQAFLPDLSMGWLTMPAAPPLYTGPASSSSVLYHRDNRTETYEPLAMGPVEPREFVLQGYSADGSSGILQLKAKLTDDATAGLQQLYFFMGDQLHLVCILPNGSPASNDCSAGSPPESASGRTRTANLTNAISEDGSKVYWSALPFGEEEPGKLYLRLNPEQLQSPLDSEGRCEDPSAACTLPVATKAARFWAASADGSNAIYTITEKGPKEGNLEEFNLAEEASSLIAKKVVGIVGHSEDLSNIYFVSEEALGGESVDGEPNLYLHHEGVSRFIATLTATDVRLRVGGDAALPSNVAPQPVWHPAAATPSGQHLVFISTGELTGYDNRDRSSGEVASEVYLYDAGSGEVRCVSCNPSGSRPAARLVQTSGNQARLLMAASVPAAYNQLTVPRVVSEDGDRLFFNSYDALLPADVNGKEDVYEWERPGSGDCTEENPAFSLLSGGCISLISSGESASDSELLDSDPSGQDVFFTTNASLLPQDPGLIDVYDAREGGGFPAPSPRPAACEGEACQGPYNPPNDPTPGSSSFEGSGNVSKAAVRKKHKKKHSKKHKRKKAAAKRGSRR